MLRATTACTFSTSQLPKVVQSWCALYILTSKCALRHNGVHFFHISTSKSGPELVCFVHFDFEMCFVPQRRALLRATTACTFSTSQLHKRASRHNGVQFLISHLPNGLRIMALVLKLPIMLAHKQWGMFSLINKVMNEVGSLAYYDHKCTHIKGWNFAVYPHYKRRASNYVKSFFGPK